MQVAQLVVAAGGVDSQPDAGLVQAAHGRVDAVKEGGVLGQPHDVFQPAVAKGFQLVLRHPQVAHGVDGGHAVGDLELLVGRFPVEQLDAGHLQGINVVVGVDRGAVQVKDHRFVLSSLHKILLILHGG